MLVKTKKAKQKLPSWPKERDIACYSAYGAIDFTQDLSLGKIWLDVGCRTGKALIEARKLCKAKLIGINAHKIRVRKGIHSIVASIPENSSIYKKYKKKIHLVTDIHGAVSYCDNPLEALIYESCLLTPSAKAVIVTLEERLGNQATWKQIQHFFTTVMRQTIQFKKFTTYSDNTKTPIKTLRITIQGNCQSKLELNNLFTEARLRVGQMKKTKVIGGPTDKSCQIWRVMYDQREFSGS